MFKNDLYKKIDFCEKAKINWENINLFQNMFLHQKKKKNYTNNKYFKYTIVWYTYIILKLNNHKTIFISLLKLKIQSIVNGNLVLIFK